jgi:predicted metal-dependent hydrolase
MAISPFSFFINSRSAVLTTSLLQHMVFKLNYDFQISTDLYHLHFEEGREPHATIKRTPESAIVYMPKGFRFEGAASLEWANKVLATALRNNAQVILTQRLRNIATLHNIQFNRLTIKDVSTRWGSCSSLRNVNLSLWLLLLPSHLIDYVIAHELCHLKELNHRPAFWAELDTLCGGTGSGKRLDKELATLEREIMKQRLK